MIIYYDSAPKNDSDIDEESDDFSNGCVSDEEIMKYYVRKHFDFFGGQNDW